MNIYLNIIFLLAVVVIFFIMLNKKKYRWSFIKKNKVSIEKIVLEDILKNIYLSNKDGHYQRINNLVKQLPFKESIILRTVKQMLLGKLIICYNNELELTKEGKAYALRIIKAHRLWEQYLAEKTGYDKRHWHELAEKYEHRLTEDQVDTLIKELKKPIFDPHGSPIPYGESIDDIEGNPITEYPKGTIGRIVHIQDDITEIYHQILKEEIHIGSQVEITKVEQKYIHFHSEGKDHMLDNIVAASLSILPIVDEEVANIVINRLSNLKEGERARIIGISKECVGENKRRLLDLGFVKGTNVKNANVSPMGDPTAYMLRKTLIALRKDQSKFILIEKYV